MMPKRFFYLMIVSLSLAISSCQQDISETLAAHAWHCISLDVVLSTGETLDLYTFFYPDCSRDDAYTFHENGTFLFDTGTNICSPTDSLVVEGTWTLGDDQKSITISSDNQTLTWTIRQLESNLLETSTPYTNPLDSLVFGTLISTWVAP